MDGIAFEWDSKKNSANRLKHGVRFAETFNQAEDR